MTAQGETRDVTAASGDDDPGGAEGMRGADGAEGAEVREAESSGGVQEDVARTFGGALPLPAAEGEDERERSEDGSQPESGGGPEPEDAVPPGHEAAQRRAEEAELVGEAGTSPAAPAADDDEVTATRQLPQLVLPPMPPLPPPLPDSPPLPPFNGTPPAGYPPAAAPYDPAPAHPAPAEPAPADPVPADPVPAPHPLPADEPAEATTLLLPPVPADADTPPPPAPQPDQPYVGGPTPAHGTPLPPQATTAPAPHPDQQYVGGSTPAPGTALPPQVAAPAPAAPHPQAYVPPPAVPVSVPVTGPEVAEVKRRARHGDSMPRRTVQALHRLVSSTARETTIATETARAIQQPVYSGRQLAVTSIRGGAGKSTVAALLSLTYAHYRNDPTLTVEADPALGTIPGRLGASEIRWTCADLARIVNPSMRLTDITGYLVRLPGGGWLLPASQGAVGAQLDLDTYRVVITSLGRYFGTTVVDCETLPAEVARTSLTTTQARVLVTPATVEGVAATRSVLDWMGNLHPRMLATTVVAMSHAVPDTALDEAKASRHLAVGGATVVSVPYDRHLAAGGAIRTELLGHHTRAAAARLAAECMTRAVTFDQP